MNFNQSFKAITKFYIYLKDYTNPSIRNDYILLNESFIEQEKVLNKINSELDIQNLYNKPSEDKIKDYEFQVKQLFEIAMGKRENYVYSYPVLYSLKMGIELLGHKKAQEATNSNMNFLIDGIETYIKKKIF